MKNFKMISSLALFLAFGFSNAQKIGVVDTDAILQKMPQYKEAEARLDAQISTWQTELQNLQSEYDRKKSAFDNEKVLLIGTQLAMREKEVLDLEKNVKTTMSLRFGNNGEINKLKTNLVVPFEDQIHNAITAVAERNKVDTMLDKNRNNVLYLQKPFDYTDRVLQFLLKGTFETDTDKKQPPAKGKK
ncbi:OmpH family outer membrane protein [Chryseobacterium sp. SIMBA_029]|uniref:OmpH family outer membrane protein n=1 Tax=Chryseobacterium sp. SIMBA_029 TaxID=3085772 RepID=UPI00397CC6C6